MVAKNSKKVIILGNVCNITTDNECDDGLKSYDDRIRYNNIIITNKEKVKQPINLKYIYY